MKAGTAEIKITPTGNGLFLVGALAPSTGVHDDLWARVLVLDDGDVRVAIVTMDHLGMSLDDGDQLRNHIEAEAGVKADHVFLCYSHTHSAPLTIPWSVLGREQGAAHRTAWCQEVTRRVSQAVATAVTKLAPARLHSGRAAVQIGHNRRLTTPAGILMAPNPDGPVAPWTDVLLVTDAAEQPVALLFSHAAHPVSVHGASSKISADYPGYAVAEIRRQLGASVQPMFASGCGADCNVEPLRGGVEAAAAAGRTLGAAAVLAARHSQRLQDCVLSAVREQAPLPFASAPAADDLREFLDGGALGNMDLEKSSDQETKAWYDADAARCLSELIGPRTTMQAALDFRVQGLALNESFAMLGLSHEPFVNYQLLLERLSPFAHTMALGYVNGVEGYVPNDQALLAGGYETAPLPLPGAPLRYRHRRNLAMGVESRVTAALRRTLTQLTSEIRSTKV